ncbi:DUF2793 domain-containing protein [Accumulibacter sp.]|uniref:DUF2793 domain-containing protein n=1 Tax=Accumulibacter sp. TaxID=2053492 RepID=UPI002D1FBCBA|nr:DUF2793 domain-containing protein [Accumulibacter sp.]
MEGRHRRQPEESRGGARALRQGPGSGQAAGDPARWECYLNPAGPTGIWSGRGGQIAVRIGGAREFHALRVGWLFCVADERCSRLAEPRDRAPASRSNRSRFLNRGNRPFGGLLLSGICSRCAWFSTGRRRRLRAANRRGGFRGNAG